MKITIVGTGSVALATAALLYDRGYHATLVSISGAGAQELTNRVVTTSGSLNVEFPLHVSQDPASAIGQAEAVILATSANRYKDAMDSIIPYMNANQHMLISGELSQAAAYLQDQLTQRGIEPPITSLATTLVTGRRGDGASVRVGVIRASALAFTRPHLRQKEELAFWNTLFGDVLKGAGNALEVTLSNLNPIVHIPNALCNFTRMEKAEDWGNYEGITRGVARLLTAIDEERIALAEAFDLNVKSFKAKYVDNFGYSPQMDLSEMTADLHVRRKGLPKGPASVETRYVTEDVPFGLVVFEHLGTVKNIPTPVISSAITVASTLYGREFRTENPFLPMLDGLVGRVK